MSKKITIIHTTVATISSIPTLLQQQYKNLSVINILDDSLLNEIKEKGEITKAVMERVVQYTTIAKQNGSDAILVACSSIGKAVTIAREIIDIPIYRIDEPMANEAVKLGHKILVLGTVKSTLLPTCELLQSKIVGSSQTVKAELIPNVFEMFTTNREEHDRQIAQVIQAYQNEYDVIVLAQVSMSDAIQYVSAGHATILTSLPLGIYQLQDLIIS